MLTTAQPVAGNLGLAGIAECDACMHRTVAAVPVMKFQKEQQQQDSLQALHQTQCIFHCSTKSWSLVLYLVTPVFMCFGLDHSCMSLAGADVLSASVLSSHIVLGSAVRQLGLKKR